LAHTSLGKPSEVSMPLPIHARETIGTPISRLHRSQSISKYSFRDAWIRGGDSIYSMSLSCKHSPQ